MHLSKISKVETPANQRESPPKKKSERELKEARRQRNMSLRGHFKYTSEQMLWMVPEEQKANMKTKGPIQKLDPLLFVRSGDDGEAKQRKIMQRLAKREERRRN